MKKRMIIILIAVVVGVVYQGLLPEPDSFTAVDFQEVSSEDFIYSTSVSKNVLAFYKGEGIGVAYFKPTVTGWKLVNKASHDGQYQWLSKQYIPKKAFGNTAVVYGKVVDANVNRIKVITDDSQYVATMVNIDDTKIWYQVLDKDESNLLIQGFDHDEKLFEIEMDNSWLTQ